jgi:hypothetical protein
VNDKQPHHGDGGPSGSFVRVPLVFVLGEYTRDDEVAGCHSNGANHQDGFTSEIIDPDNSRDL